VSASLIQARTVKPSAPPGSLPDGAAMAFARPAKQPALPDGIYPCTFEGAAAWLIRWRGQEGCLRWATEAEAREQFDVLQDRKLLPALKARIAARHAGKAPPRSRRLYRRGQ
jgi:hypothetical protein